MAFSYTAVVARTPAYDGTAVRSPDPVFRRLTNTVDPHLAYQGDAGQNGSASVSVNAALSTPRRLAVDGPARGARQLHRFAWT